MPPPSEANYSVAALTAAHTAFRDLIDAGMAAGQLRILSDSDTLLAQMDLAYPCGSVDAGTGRLTFFSAGLSAPIDATGTAAYGEFCDASGQVHLSLPAQAGVTPVAGRLVLDALSLDAGGTVVVQSATVG